VYAFKDVVVHVALFIDAYRRMINAEDIILFSSGYVLRLSGLYNKERGPHSFWLSRLLLALSSGSNEARLEGNGNGVVCLLNYQDAAAAVVALYEYNPNNSITGSVSGNCLSID
jgi:hypothetical protein